MILEFTKFFTESLNLFRTYLENIFTHLQGETGIFIGDVYQIRRHEKITCFHVQKFFILYNVLIYEYILTPKTVIISKSRNNISNRHYRRGPEKIFGGESET